MTAPTITEDFMFDLDLQIVPVEEGKDLLPRAGSYIPCTTPCTAAGCPTQTPGCRTYYTCTRCQ